MKSYLKVKIKSLAAEATIIRIEERRAIARRAYAVLHQANDLALIDEEIAGLHQHRTSDVRVEARSAALAYAFLRQKPYAAVEPPGSREPHKGRVADMIAKYGRMPKAAAQTKLAEWLAPVASPSMAGL